jgi:hypothetical protein
MSNNSFSSLPPGAQCMLVCSGIIVAIPVLVYTFFGLYYLVLDVDVCETYSDLWIYGVVTFGFITISVPARILLSRIDYGKPTREFFANIHPALKPDWFIWLPVWMGWVCYGGVILYGDGYVCSDMKSEGLYYWAMVTFWLNVSIAFLLFACLIPAILCKKRDHLHNEGTDEERAMLRT